VLLAGRAPLQEHHPRRHPTLDAPVAQTTQRPLALALAGEQQVDSLTSTDCVGAPVPLAYVSPRPAATRQRALPSENGHLFPD
jgi:hypothetical protein